MYRSYVTSALIALALTCTVATRASAQNPFNINGVVPDTGIPGTVDPSGAAKELGPKNASNTKVGVIMVTRVLPARIELGRPGRGSKQFI